MKGKKIFGCLRMDFLLEKILWTNGNKLEKLEAKILKKLKST